MALGLSFCHAAILLLCAGDVLGTALQKPLQTLEGIPKRVAIIGAGAGGSSSAYNLRKYADSSVQPINITVFERASYIGGRSTTVNIFDDPAYPVELGASIFTQANEHLVNASRELGLTFLDAAHARPRESPSTLGVWDGYQFVYTMADSHEWWNIAKLLWRYGITPIRAQLLMRNAQSKFLQIYDGPVFPFESLTHAVGQVGLQHFAASPGDALLEENSISPKFAREVIQASTRVNYGQNLALIHGLETMVCMAAGGAMSIEGGNWQIFDGMLKASRADIRLNSTVKSISRNSDGSTVSLTYVTSTGAEYTSIFDEIIIAAPLQYSGLDLHDLPLDYIPDSIPYVKLHVTVFSSPHRLSPAYFGLRNADLPPETILTTLPAGMHLGSRKDGVGPAGFWSISILQTVDAPAGAGKNYVYKIFSPERPTASFIAQILGLRPNSHVTLSSSNSSSIGDFPKSDITWFHEKIWNPYPFLYPRVTFDELSLAQNIWYTSGVEGFISTMETSALMGRNIAALISRSWQDEEDDEILLWKGPEWQMIEL